MILQRAVNVLNVQIKILNKVMFASCHRVISLHHMLSAIIKMLTLRVEA